MKRKRDGNQRINGTFQQSENHINNEDDYAIGRAADKELRL
jgi:hypothetical protein